MENGSPVEEKVASSTHEILAPRAVNGEEALRTQEVRIWDLSGWSKMRFATGGTLTDGEGRAHVGDLERVEDNRGQITLGLGGAGKVCELALPSQHTEAGSTQKVSQKPRHTRLKLYTSKLANGILQGLIPAELRTGRCHAGPRQTGTRCRAASAGKDLHFAKRGVGR